MSIINTLAPGIAASDIIIRAALLYGLQDMRNNPWLLQYVFASLLNDPLTDKEYGQAGIDRAAEWFLNTEIPIYMAFKVQGPPPIPCISVALLSSNEAENTLGDINYDTHEEMTEDGVPWGIIGGPFSSAAYDPTTGLVTLPTTNTAILSSWQDIVTKTGKNYPILKIKNYLNECYIAPGLTIDLTGCTTRVRKPSRSISLESLVFDEEYFVGCHAKDPVELIYLHSVIVFCLLRYKERCLEGRGFGESTVSSTDLKKNPAFEQLGIAEPVYSRYCSVRGKVRNYWPKDIIVKPSAVVTFPVPSRDNLPDVGLVIETSESAEEIDLDIDPLLQR